MSKEMDYDDRKEWARLLYTEHDEKALDIALTTGVDETIIHKWIADGKWEIRVCALSVSKTAELKNLYKSMRDINGKIQSDATVNTKDVDQALKYSAMIKNLETETSVSQVIEVSELFVRWLRRRDLQLAKKIAIHLDAFITERCAA